MTSPPRGPRAWTASAGTPLVAGLVVVVVGAVVGALLVGVAGMSGEPVSSDGPAPVGGSGRAGAVPPPGDSAVEVWSTRPDRLRPLTGTGLPEVVRLGPAPRRPLDRAAAAFTLRRGERLGVVLVAADGRRQGLRVPDSRDIVAVADSPATAVLSPGGTRVLLPRPGGLLVHEVGTRGWRRVDTGATQTAYADWVGDDRVWLPYDPRSGSAPVVDLEGRSVATEDRHRLTSGRWWGARPVGPTRSTGGSFAQAWTAPRDATFAGPGDDLVVVAHGAEQTAVLVRPDGGGSTRVDAWLDEQTLVLDDGERVLALDVGSGDVDLLARVVGVPRATSWTASWADLDS